MLKNLMRKMKIGHTVVRKFYYKVFVEKRFQNSFYSRWLTQRLKINTIEIK